MDIRNRTSIHEHANMLLKIIKTQASGELVITHLGELCQMLPTQEKFLTLLETFLGSIPNQKLGPKPLSFVPQMIGKENWREKMNDFGSSIPNDALKV